MSSTGISQRVNAPRASVYRALHGLLPGLSPADNELGWRTSLRKLAALVEAG